MYPGKVVRLVVAQENGGMEGPCVGPATAQNLPLVANRLEIKKRWMTKKRSPFLFTCWWTSYPTLHIPGDQPCSPGIAKNIQSQARSGHTWGVEKIGSLAPVRSHLKKSSHLWGGTSSILWMKSIFPPVRNTCSRDGLRAPGNNCDRVVLEVVVPGLPWTKIYVEGNLYLINSIMDSSSTTLFCSLSIIRARGVLS